MEDVRWRPAEPEDAADIARLSLVLLGAFGEDEGIFAERLLLCPEGCFVLAGAAGVAGYMVSHPWRRGDPPALHRPIGAIPGDADCWYIHDVAIEAGQRGTGAAGRIVEAVGEVARRAGFATIALVAVAGADGYWRRLGFEDAMSEALRAALTPYGADAVYMERDGAGRAVPLDVTVS